MTYRQEYPSYFKFSDGLLARGGVLLNIFTILPPPAYILY